MPDALSLADLAPVVVSGIAVNATPIVKPPKFEIVSDDGDTRVTIGPPEDDAEESDFYDNIADRLPSEKLATIATQLITDIDADNAARQGWLETRTRGLAMLGLELKEPRGDLGTSAAPLEGMSNVTAPLLLTEVLRAQATARGELLPADGPVKVVDESNRGSGARDEIADALERDFNTYLTRVCTEYYPDTDRMLFYTAFGGVGFKKVYHCPIRNRPVSESVDASDLIIEPGATDIENAKRVTHVIPMRVSMLRRMMMVGAYREVEIGAPFEQPDPVREKKAEIEGTLTHSQQQYDQNHTIYEVCCEWDFDEGPDGLALPYIVTVDKDSRQVLAVRRNWREDDPLYLKKPLYVRFPYIDAIGIYGIGLLHVLGNTSAALTAAWREMLDAGMFSCFPGFLYADEVARQDTNEFRIPPGGGMKVQTAGKPLRDAVMPLPYQPPSAVLLQFAQWMQEQAKASASSADIPIGEGVSNVPVGTIMAMLEQATRVMSAVHKRLHTAQAEEFRLLAALLKEDPEAFWEHGARNVYAWDKETFLRAIDTFELAPVSDPNSPTHTHRMLKAQALKMLQGMNPQMYDAEAIDSHVLRMLGFSDPQEFFAKNPTPQPNPAAELAQAHMAEAQMNAQAKQRDAQLRLVETQIKAQQAAADRASKEKIEAAKLAIEKQRLGADLATDALDGAHTARQAVLDRAAGFARAAEGAS